MKCLLLLLASGLVTSDKLDRAYLPPPGAKYSGGTFDDLNPPLEFPKETYKGVIQNAPLANSYTAGKFTEIPNNHGIGKEISPVSHSFLSFPNNIKQTTPFVMNRYKSVIPTSGPVLSMYGDMPSNVPSSGYLPSKQSIFDTQSHNTLKYVPGFDGNGFISGGDKKVTEYNYIPAKKHNRNSVVNFNLNNNGYPNVKINQFPNQANNGGLLSNRQHFIPKTVTTKENVENYHPSSFGFYGGNPMIMTSHDNMPQEPRSMKFTSKYGSYENNMPGSLDQNKVKPNEKSSARPFSTPLVGPNSENVLKHTSTKTTINAYGAIPSQFPSTTSKSFKKNIPTKLEQRNGIPVRNKVRQEAPQTDFERNAVIINYDNSITPEGYSYSYDTSNGIHVDETGIATNGVRAKGSYSYTGDDGNIYTVTYTADENGFQPKGDHLPTAPPIPEAIQRVIEQAARSKVDGIFDDGSYDENKYGHMNYQGAMDRYNTFRENRIKSSRLNDTKRKPSRFQHNKSMTKFGNIVHNNIIPGTNDQTIENLSNFETEGKNVNHTHLQGNKLSNGSALSTGTRSNFKKIITNEEQLNNQTTEPIAYINNKQIANKEQEPTNIQNINVTAINTEAAKSNQNINLGTSSRKPFIDKGYYYVPPIIKFNENTENPLPSSKKNSHFTSSKTIPKIIKTGTNKRIGFDEFQRRRTDNEERSTQANTNSIASEPTRQPYISGPDDQDKDKSDTKPSDLYTNNLESSLHKFDTTPMITQATQESQVPGEYAQYYQSTTNPTILDQTLPNTVENWIKLPSRNPGITVSQDVVTTTYRPLLSGDGVLEVNQNVKIYGIGKPETTTPFNGYPEKKPDSNVFYTETTTNGQTPMGEYPIYAGPVQDNAVFQEIPNQGVPYGNKYLTTEMPGTNLGINTEQYYNTGFDELSPGLEPNAPIFNVNDFGNPEPIPEQEVTTPNMLNQNPGPGGKIIGEDFSGPGHPQKFDPETGYYYE